MSVVIIYTEGNVQKVSSIHLLVGCFFKSVLEFLLKKGFDILSNFFDILIKINYYFIPFYLTLLTNIFTWRARPFHILCSHHLLKVELNLAPYMLSMFDNVWCNIETMSRTPFAVII